MKQIILTTSKEKNNAIIDKTVKGVSYVSGDFRNNPQLIITFTDDTYIYLTATMAENEFDGVHFENDFIVPMECYQYPPGTISIDKNGNRIFKYKPNIEDQIRLGLFKPDREKEKLKIQEHEELANKKEYEIYLELKKKYEPN